MQRHNATNTPAVDPDSDDDAFRVRVDYFPQIAVTPHLPGEFATVVIEELAGLRRP